jgi:hypothetical protein
MKSFWCAVATTDRRTGDGEQQQDIGPRKKPGKTGLFS